VSQNWHGFGWGHGCHNWQIVGVGWAAKVLLLGMKNFLLSSEGRWTFLD
jgi:hypothetical protein